MFLRICFVLFFCVVICSCTKKWTKLKEKHNFKNLTNQKLSRVVGRHDMDSFKKLLRPILVERVPDTEGSRVVRQYIVEAMRKLNWAVELDEFRDATPLGEKKFVNIIATQRPDARRWLTLVCHYDSKLMERRFVAATDSAVPCAMMLHLAHVLKQELADNDQAKPDLSLQFLFLDGEEAFVNWGPTDSLYGARHLAHKWKTTPYPPNNNDSSTMLDRIDVFVLLDLLGAANPQFFNWFPETSRHYHRLVDIERRLVDLQRTVGDEANVMTSYPRTYFSPSLYNIGQSSIQDDHIPFLKKDVPVIHLISVPFPATWHTSADNEAHLDYDTIQNLNTILRVFVTEYLHLNPREQ